jgi:hypothetical protein
VGAVSSVRIGRLEPKGGTRSSYEKSQAAGSKSQPHCPKCGIIYDLMELSMVEQLDAMTGVLLCESCKDSI